MEENKEYDEYDKKAFIEAEIIPVIQELKRKCLVNKVPFCFSIAYKNKKSTKKNLKNANGGETKYYNDGLLPYPENIKLYENYFDNFLLAMRGGQFVSPVMANNIFAKEAEELSGFDEMTKAVLQEEDEDNFNTEVNLEIESDRTDEQLKQILESYDSVSVDMEDATEVVIEKKIKTKVENTVSYTSDIRHNDSNEINKEANYVESEVSSSGTGKLLIIDESF